MFSTPFEAPPRRESPHVDVLLDIDELEEPLLSISENELQQTADEAAAVAVEAPYVPARTAAPWPALRRTSVSVRKISPVIGFDPNEILSPTTRFGGSALGSGGSYTQEQQRDFSFNGHHTPPTTSTIDGRGGGGALTSAIASTTTTTSTSDPESALPYLESSVNTNNGGSGSGGGGGGPTTPSLLPLQQQGHIPASQAPPPQQQQQYHLSGQTQLNNTQHEQQAPSRHELNQQQHALPPRLHRPRVHAALTGFINAIIGMPVMLSFAAIIFRHPFFDPYLSPLVKVVFLSSALHQAVFAAGSSMPFAVGQVQDVGLIFLSAMASGVVEDCIEAGVSAQDTLATVLATLTIATTFVGLLIVATGALKLASFVQFCPLPVVGGYLAYVGAFMFLSGAGLAAGVQVTVSPKTWLALFHTDPLLHLLPAAVMAAALSIVQRRARSPYALPLFLVAVPAAFYVFIFCGGWSLEEVRAAGWMAAPSPQDAEWKFWNMYHDLYHFEWEKGASWLPQNIYWPALPREIGKCLGLYFVVAFGSSMDIAAIQSDVPEVNYNSELVTVGLSNVATGIVGVGLTGSYIFSQTLFSLKMGVTSRVMGTIVAVAEILVFMTPINLLAFLPYFFFGALVLWIGFDIGKDMLYVSKSKVSTLEFMMLVGTFLAVSAFGLEAGIGVGVLAAALHFSVEYARMSVKAFTVVPSRSGAVRSFRQRMVLEAFDGRVAAVSLSGMVFFGSATIMAEKVLAVAAALLETQPRGKPQRNGNGNSIGDGASNQKNRGEGEGEEGEGEEERMKRRREEGRFHKHQMKSVPSMMTLCSTYDGVAALADVENGSGGETTTTTTSGGGTRPFSHVHLGSTDLFRAAGEALQEAPLILLLDLSRVHGIDATAARSFSTLNNRLTQRGVQLVLTGLHSDDAGSRMKKLLVGQGLILQKPSSYQTTDTAAANNSMDTTTAGGGGTTSTGVPAGTCAWFSSMDDGLTWCEESFLAIAEKYHLCEPPPVCVTLSEVFRTNLEVPRAFLGMGSVDYTTAAGNFERFCVKQSMDAGQILFERGDAADSIFIVESGSVACLMDYTVSSVRSRAAAAAVPGDLAVSHAARVLVYGPGGIVGDLDFTLQRPRSFIARCRRGGTLWQLQRVEFERLATEAPQVLVLLQTVVLRLNCLSASHAFEALERSDL